MKKQQKKDAKACKVQVLVYKPKLNKYVMEGKAISECTVKELLNMDIDEYCALRERVLGEKGGMFLY